MNLFNVFFSRLWLLAVASQHLGTWKALAQGMFIVNIFFNAAGIVLEYLLF